MESILFVCLGNICRSPTAKAVFDHRLEAAGLRITTDSAGTTGYHQGRPPDPRAIHAAGEWGVDISSERARIVTVEDFTRFDRIYAMDHANLSDLRQRMPADATAQLGLLMSLAPDYGVEEVPDPYYGGEEGFIRVIDMLVTAADGLIEELGKMPGRS